MNLGLVPFIDMYSDPDAINQLIITMVKPKKSIRERLLVWFCVFQCQQIPLTIDNFLLVVRTTDSKAELETLIERLDIETNRWRSKDTGGENGERLIFAISMIRFFCLDADIRATLNSYQYLKKLLIEKKDIQVRLDPMIFVCQILS